MKSLEFENTQGINLQYTIANTGERVIAYLIDLVIFGGFLIIMGFVLNPRTSEGWLLFTAFLLVPVLFFYTLAMEWLNDGQSLGKMALGLKVVRIDGRPAVGYDYLMRWMFRMIDLYMTLGSLAAISVSATQRGQRLGDMMADTTVIQTRTGRVSLNRIVNLKKLEKYEPKFPQVMQLSEEQMMLIKETVSRYRANASRGHELALEELNDRVREILQIEQKAKPIALMETLVKDYIALSR